MGGVWPSVDGFEQKRHAARGKLFGVLTYGCQARHTELGKCNAVEADDGNIVRRAQAAIKDGAQRADCHQVAHAEHCRHARKLIQQAFHGAVGAFQRETGCFIPSLFLEGKPVAFHRPAASGKAFPAGVGLGKTAADHGNAPVSVPQKIFHHGPGRRRVVHADAGQVGEGKAFGGGGQQDRGHGDFRKALQKRFPVGAEEEQAAGMRFPAELQSGLELVALLVQIDKRRGQGSFLNARLQLFDQACKQRVAGSLDHNSDGAGFLLFEPLGVVVGGKPVQADQLLHTLPGGGANVRVTAQNTGNRADRAASLACNVFDGDGKPSLRKEVGNGSGNVSRMYCQSITTERKNQWVLRKKAKLFVGKDRQWKNGRPGGILIPPEPPVLGKRSLCYSAPCSAGYFMAFFLIFSRMHSATSTS